MQPYVNPFYFQNQFTPNFGMNNMPQYQAQQPIGISGKYVNDFNEINASDIPMNSPAIFAKNDRSEVQLREWNANGQIVTTVYKPYIEPLQETQENVQANSFDFKTELLEPIFDRLESIETQLSKLNKTTTSKKAVAE